MLFNGANVPLTNVLSLLSYNDNKLNFASPRNVSGRIQTILFAFSNLYIKKKIKREYQQIMNVYILKMFNINITMKQENKSKTIKSPLSHNKQFKLSLLTRVVDA